MSEDALEELCTVRDWLRYAVSRFNKAGLAYGHGTTNALDEAAFLILSSLHLPIDQLDPWLDARLTVPERQLLHGVIEARVTTRKPAAYIRGEAWIGGHRFHVDERVIVPRSFIGELLCGDVSLWVPDQESVQRVLDLCTGGGSLAILAALRFPEALIDATDISGDALEVARINVADYGLEDRIRLLEGDLFAPLRTARYDLILSNPPYVSAASLAAFPPEHQAEPRLAHEGGEDGLDVVRRILAGARKHLKPDGIVVVEVGTGRTALESAFPDLPFLWLDTEESAGEVFQLTATALAKA